MAQAAVATRYTYEFVRRHVPDRPSDLLEIGCGSGELARVLVDDGFAVVALDSDQGCVAAAKGLGVDARLSRWPAEQDRQYDAVLFTRSLHHIEPLGHAVAAAVAALRPSGRIIVEDFRAEGASARSNSWYKGLATMLDAAGALRGEVALEQVLARCEPDDHEHKLHSSSALADALARFGDVEREDAAYYFRYLEPELSSPAASEALLRHELQLMNSGAMEALGSRFVLTPEH